MTEKTDLETLKNELAAWHRLADVRGMHCGACSRFEACSKLSSYPIAKDETWPCWTPKAPMDGKGGPGGFRCCKCGCCFDPSEAVVLAGQCRDCDDDEDRLPCIVGGDVAENFTPTCEKINALPDPLREYIRDLEQRYDPAGEVAALSQETARWSWLRKCWMCWGRWSDELEN